MRYFAVAAAVALSLPCDVSAQSPRVRLIFVPETPADSAAAAEYTALWERNESRVVAALERFSGLRFIRPDYADTSITVRVVEAPANSGYRERPMRIRSSYSADTKLATLAHELGHRLQSHMFTRDEDEHQYLFLWLYDAWVSLEGREWADRQVAIERQRGERYVQAWDQALASGPDRRGERWNAIRKERDRL
jgi:hypothetical protein